jgi:hypothetical protein
MANQNLAISNINTSKSPTPKIDLENFNMDNVYLKGKAFIH